MLVDTNYFLRWLLADNQNQTEKVKEVFRQAVAGKIKLESTLVVFFEVYWVLSSFYKQNKKQTVKGLENILKLTFINWSNRQELEMAVELYKKTALDLEDAYNLSHIKLNKIQGLLSFDRQLIKEYKKIG